MDMFDTSRGGYTVPRNLDPLFDKDVSMTEMTQLGERPGLRAPCLRTPSEMTKGILTRHIADAVNYISELIRAQELIALQVAEFKHNDTVQTTNDTCNTPPPLHIHTYATNHTNHLSTRTGSNMSQPPVFSPAKS